MGKSNYSKTTPMTAVEKRLRDAEAASVRELLRKAPVVHEMTSTSTLRVIHEYTTIHEKLYPTSLVQTKHTIAFRK